MHASQQIAGEDLLLNNYLLAVLELNDVFQRDDDLEDPLLHVHRLGAGQQVATNLVLVAGLGVNHVPASGTVIGGVASAAGGFLLRLFCVAGLLAFGYFN